MKKEYSIPEVVITSLSNNDIITTSGITKLNSGSQTTFADNLDLNY